MTIIIVCDPPGPQIDSSLNKSETHVPGFDSIVSNLKNQSIGSQKGTKYTVGTFKKAQLVSNSCLKCFNCLFALKRVNRSKTPNRDWPVCARSVGLCLDG